MTQFLPEVFLFCVKTGQQDVFINSFCACVSHPPTFARVFIRAVVRPGGLLQRLLPDDSGNQDDPSPPGEGGGRPPLGGVRQRRVRSIETSGHVWSGLMSFITRPGKQVLVPLWCPSLVSHLFNNSSVFHLSLLPTLWILPLTAAVNRTFPAPVSAGCLPVQLEI